METREDANNKLMIAIQLKQEEIVKGNREIRHVTEELENLKITYEGAEKKLVHHDVELIK